VPEAAKVFAAPLVHQTIAQHGDWIIGSLADLQIDFDKDVDNVGRLVFALSPERLITGRRHALECVERTRANINGYRRYASASAVLESLVLEFGLRLEEAVPRLMNSLDLAEDRVLSEEVGDERMRLLLVRREVSQLHRHLRGFLKALEHAARQGASDRLSPFLRLRDRFQLIDQDIAAIEDRARLLQEEVAAKVSAGINRQLYILSLLTALFLPPSLVAGLFGMNVEHLPIAGRAGDFFFILMVAGASSLAVWLMIRHLRIRM
jgi:zinc transporter